MRSQISKRETQITLSVKTVCTLQCNIISGIQDGRNIHNGLVGLVLSADGDDNGNSKSHSACSTTKQNPQDSPVDMLILTYFPREHRNLA